MAYDLLIKNGRIVDGSGMPSFRGDIGVRDGKIAEIGKLSGAATKTVDADGRAVSPGFIDNHCHYDAQVTWDPLCTFSPEHGATTVIFGNCSLSLAPVKKGTEERLAEFLSYVEAIPMEVLKTVEFDWETIPQYMDRLDQHLGINVGNLIGHTAVRHYVMGDDCQKPGATEAQIKAMQDVVRDGMAAGALGLSVSREKGHYDPQGVPIPALWAEEDEIFALADVLRDMSTGTIQAGGGQYVELKDGMMRRLAEACGRTVVYNSLSQTVRKPGEWQTHMARVEETAALGIRAYPMCTPNRITQDFTMRNCQVFRGLKTWHPILLMSDEEKLRLYADPEIREKLHDEAVVNKPDSAVGFSKSWWNYMWVNQPVLEKNKWMQFKTIGQIADKQGKRVIDAFLDLAIEEKLETRFLLAENNVDDEALSKILTHPNAVIGLGDGGAHVQFHGGYGYITKLLGEWVREKQVLTLEQAVRRLTFDSASTFGLYDRGMLRPGLAADIAIFDPDTVKCGHETVVHDFPAGGWRIKEPAEGVHMTIVNGQVLLDEGRHTGALPGRVMRNTYWHANHG
ncbi:MAG TPA: amidohydrolase family protein [Stellaceae bacterium]|jgi:N-acyl-D-aspartate/D-glutamate deacylase|nr:amidohydrolase family protein [Stellaceae bacterium]